MNENEISKIVIDSAIEVHRSFGGPGLIESVYEEALAWEVKAVVLYNKIFEAQALTYLRMLNLKLALVINFGEKRVIDGVHRVVNGL